MFPFGASLYSFESSATSAGFLVSVIARRIGLVRVGIGLGFFEFRHCTDVCYYCFEQSVEGAVRLYVCFLIVFRSKMRPVDDLWVVRCKNSQLQPLTMTCASIGREGFFLPQELIRSVISCWPTPFGLAQILSAAYQEALWINLMKFSQQDALNKRIGVNTDNMTEEEKAKWVLNYTRAMQQEMAELIDSVP